MPFYVKDKDKSLKELTEKKILSHRVGEKKEPLVTLEPVGDDSAELKITPAVLQKNGKDTVSIRWGVGFREVSHKEVIIAESDIIIHDLTGVENRIIVLYSPQKIVLADGDDTDFSVNIGAITGQE